MKKTVFVLCAALAAVVMAGCGSAPKAEESSLKQGQSTPDANNVSADADEMKILDWYGRADGEVAQPKWMRPLLRGNGNAYCSEYGISEEYANHKWLVSSQRNASMSLSQALSESEVMFAVAQEMSTSILGTVGEELNDGQKDAVRNVCASTKATLTGIGKRGEYWRKVKIGDVTAYDYYTIYSCPRSVYNQLLNTYMIELLQSKGLDEAAVNTIKKNAQQILDDAEEQSDRVERQKERELTAQLSHEESVRSHEETVRTQSNTEKSTALANAKTEQDKSRNQAAVDMVVATKGRMNPALAALLAK